MAYDKSIHRYFREGDIVKYEVVWGKQLFVIHGFGGNAYCPELYVHFYGKPQNITNTCNFDLLKTKLVDSAKRPFKKINKRVLLNLVKKGNEEAKREFIMRSHNK